MAKLTAAQRHDLKMIAAGYGKTFGDDAKIRRFERLGLVTIETKGEWRIARITEAGRAALAKEERTRS